MAVKKPAFMPLHPEQAVKDLFEDISISNDTTSYNMFHAREQQEWPISSALKFIMHITAMAEVTKFKPIPDDTLKKASWFGGQMAIRAVALTETGSVLNQLGIQDVKPTMSTDGSRHGTFDQLATVMRSKANDIFSSLPKSHKVAIHDWSLDVADTAVAAEHYRTSFGYMIAAVKYASDELMVRQQSEAFEAYSAAAEAKLAQL